MVFMTALPREGVAELMAATDVFVLPSMIESTPLTALEAMAVGTPVVCLKAGGVPEFIANGFNGLTFVLAEDDALVKAIMRVLEDIMLADCPCENGMKTARTNSVWEVASVRRTLQVYEGIRGCSGSS